MATVSFAKAATPDQIGWRARLATWEAPLLASFLAWVGTLHQQIQDAQITHAIVARTGEIFDHVVQAFSFQPQGVEEAAAGEAAFSFDTLIRDLQPSLRLSFDVRNPLFDQAVQEHQARLVREVTGETRRAIANIIERGYRDGWPPVQIAPLIRETVGLTARQAQAVLTFHQAQLTRGVRGDVATDRAMRYAGRMRQRRAMTIARTETARAAVTGRLAGYQQAADRGLFSPDLAELEWSAVQQDPEEICGHLDGQRVPFGETFDGLLPPAHPCCRCSVHLVLPKPAVRPQLTLVR